MYLVVATVLSLTYIFSISSSQKKILILCSVSLNMIVVLFQRYEFLISGQRQYMEKPKRTGGGGRTGEARKDGGGPEGRGLPPSLGITLSLPLLDSYHENFSHRHKIHIPNKDQLLYNYRLIHNHHPNLHNFHLKPESVIQICK